MKQFKLTILLTMLMSMVGTKALAHDFAVANDDGVTIYYTKRSATEVAVTYQGNYYYSYNEYGGNAVIPESVTFNGTTYSVTGIGDEAFRDCTGLTSVSIPNSVTSIGYYAFDDCSGLTSITIPNSVTSIGEFAFGYCSGLTSITIPNSVTSIGNSTFSSCSGLTSITIPNSVTSIGDWAFYSCSGLTSITIPNSVTSIGSCAFENCTGLTSVTIPNSVTSIGKGAFAGCSGLTSITVESGNTVYDSRNNCNAIIKTASNMLIAGCQNTIIPNSVTDIGEWAFLYCSSLTSITIPNSVTHIGSSAFAGCINLQKVIVPDLAAWCSILFGDNPLNYAHHLYSDENTEITSLVIPNSVTSIGYYAFYACNSLTSITIPNSVTSIGNSAFLECNSLTSVTVENTVPISIGSGTFSNRANATLYVPKGSKSAYEAADYWKEFKEIVEMGLETTDISTLNNVIYLDEVQAVAGSQKTISIKMKNSAAIRGFQFNMTLPEGVTPATYSNGKIICSLSDVRRPEGDQHTISVTQQADGSYLFLCGSLANETFTGTDGEVLTLKINIADNMAAGDYPITLSSIKLTETNINNYYETAEVVSKLTISDYELGDINGDGVVDVSDYIGVANHILGDTPAGFNALAADVNGDHVIDISDYIGIANIILTGSIYGNNAGSRPFVEDEEPTQEPQ